MESTPGPWMAEPCTFAKSDPEAQIPEGCDFWIAGGPKGEVIALLEGPLLCGSQEANANLVAAAPQLLDSVRAFVALYDSCIDMVGESVRAKLAIARAAIAKAEGR